MGAFGKLRVQGLPDTHAVVVGDEWQRRFVSITHDNKQLTLSGGGNVQLAVAPSAGDSSDGKGFIQWPVLGKTLSFTVDLSRVACSCNAALYLVSMPGFNSTDTGHPDPRARGPGFYPMCDHHGCATAVYNQSRWALCPDTSCVIDSRRPFRHSVSFDVGTTAPNTELKAIRNRLVQGDAVFDFKTCQGTNAQWTRGDAKAYLQAMSENLRQGMVMVLSLWGLSNSGMSWLDGPTGCRGGCNVSNQSVSFGDVVLSSIVAPA